MPTAKRAGRPSKKTADLLIEKEAEINSETNVAKRFSVTSGKASGSASPPASAAIGTFFEEAVFIAGMGRSGTTLLLRLLDGHPEIFLVPVESMILSHFLPSYRATGDLAAFENALLARFSRMMKNPQRRDLAIARWREILRRRARAGKLSPRVLFRDLLECLTFEQSTEGRRVWLEKTPKNELHLKEIFENFPRARVIFNIRDPRGVYASLKKAKDSKVTPAMAAAKWAQRLGFLQSFLLRYPRYKNRVFLIRYEDYVSYPEQTIAKLLNFLNLEPSFPIRPTLFGSPWKGNSFDASTDTPGEIDPRKIDSWRKELTRDEIAEILRSAAFEMALLGYKE